MLPEHLYIIREILIEKKMHHSFDRLNEIFDTLLTKQTCQLYRDGLKKEYRDAVEFEINNDFSFRKISHEITSIIINKLVHCMKKAQITESMISKKTGLTPSVVSLCLKGHGSFENIVQIATCVGSVFGLTSWVSLFEQFDLEPKKVALNIEPMQKFLYTYLKNHSSRFNNSFEELGGAFDFKSTEVENQKQINVTGKLHVLVDDDKKPVHGNLQYIAIQIRLTNELRRLYIQDYERNSFSPALSVDDNYTLTVKELLNSVITNPFDESDDFLSLLCLPIRIREDLTMVDRVYRFTLYCNGKLSRFAITFNHPDIEIVPIIQEPEEGQPILPPVEDGNEGDAPNVDGEEKEEEESEPHVCEPIVIIKNSIISDDEPSGYDKYSQIWFDIIDE